MINLLSSELFKLKKSKSFRIAAILTVLFAWFAEAADVIVKRAYPQGMAAYSTPYADTLDIVRQLFANTNAIIYVTIFICIFVLGDYTCGAIKNYVGKGYRREEIYLAKFLVTEFGAVMLYLLTAVAAFAGGIVCYGTEQLDGAFYHDFISYLSLHILYLTGYTAIIVLVCGMARNMAVGIIVSMLGVMLMSNVLVQAADMVIRYFGADFAVSEYWITTVISGCPVTEIPAQFITSSGMTTVVWLIAAMVGGMLWFSRRDVS
ncbi:MAG: ABC transporter permease subunit [Lachnospiraceae bacterium]|nr:ABC transporter permease subunit [Lachnospiraceae bacterium]